MNIQYLRKLIKNLFFNFVFYFTNLQNNENPIIDMKEKTIHEKIEDLACDELIERTDHKKKLIKTRSKFKNKIMEEGKKTSFFLKKFFILSK